MEEIKITSDDRKLLGRLISWLNRQIPTIGTQTTIYTATHQPDAPIDADVCRELGFEPDESGDGWWSMCVSSLALVVYAPLGAVHLSGTCLYHITTRNQLAKLIEGLKGEA